LANAFISLCSTYVQTIHTKSIILNSIVMFSLKPCTLAGFEPGSYVPQVKEGASASRRQGKLKKSHYTNESFLNYDYVIVQLFLYTSDYIESFSYFSH
jgi:hypothetical protein